MSKTVWVVNHYAGAPGYSRGLRHYHLASCWKDSGAAVTIFAAKYHHLFHKLPSASGKESVEGVNYIWVDAPEYIGNGIKRFWNMICFSLMLMFKPWHKTLQQTPTTVLVSSPHLFAWVAAFFLAKKHKARLVFEVRDLWPLSLVALAGLKKYHPIVMLFSLLERFAYRYSSLVVSNLPYANKYMERRGLSCNRFHWIPNGVCFEESRTVYDKKSSLITRLDQLCSQGRLIVFYAGGHGLPNALDQVIDAAALVEKQSKNIQFVFVGEGEEKANLEEKARKLGLSNVEFHSPVDKLVINTALLKVDAGLATVQDNAIYQYGVSLNKLFDYMGAAIPVIYVVPGRYNPVAEAGCGISVQPGKPEQLADGILGLMSLPKSTRIELGDKGLDYVREVHDYRTLAEKYLQLL